jgi:hypothetical protein
MLAGRGGTDVVKRAWIGGVVAVVAAGLAFGAEEEASRRLAAAVARGDAAQVAALVRQGADPDAADRSGWTGLHLAAETGDVALARLLLAAGARPDVRSRARGTPLDIAETTGRIEIARLLRLHGAKGSGKSIGDTVCVRPWQGAGYCAVVVSADPTRYRLRVSRIVGCGTGCAPDPACSAGETIGAGGLGEGSVLWVPASCLTHTGVR